MLTPREKQVALLVAQGYSNPQIAAGQTLRERQCRAAVDKWEW